MSPSFFPSGYGSFTSSGGAGASVEAEPPAPDVLTDDPEILEAAWQAGRTANLRQRWLAIFYNRPVARGVAWNEMIMDLTGRGLPTDKAVREAYVGGHIDTDAADEK